MVLWLVPILLVGYWVGYEKEFPGIGSPLHAQCKIKWNWPHNDCKEISEAFIKQIEEWTPEDNCANGGQKCLYSLKEQQSNFIKATHTTPIKRYVDTLTFDFKPESGCTVDVN